MTNAIREFTDVVDRLDVPRRQPRAVEAALRRRLEAMSAAQIEAFQHGFDLALAGVRTPELWAAASIVHDGLDPHDYDGFAAWLLLQGQHVVRRAQDDPDAVIAALTRRLFAPRRRPRWDGVLELAQRVYEARFDRDLYDVVAAPTRSLGSLVDGEAKPAVHWTHPDILMRRFPQLWRAFETRGLRVMPMSDESEACSCCGRVHVDAYGLLGWKRAPLGAYTLHFVEGRFGHVDATVTLDDDGGRGAIFGVRHSQRGSRAGLRVLEADEMPWSPADGRSVLGRDAAHAHPRYRLALKAAMQAWECDPRLAAQRRAWRQRRLLAGASARRVARAPTDADRACAGCGQVHGDIEISHRFPDALATMSRWQWRHRVRGDEDELVLDGRRRFVRGLLPVPVAGRASTYHFGLWAERLDPVDGTRAIDGAVDAARRLERGPRALLANDLLYLPESTLGLDVGVRARADGERPRLQLDADIEHPLATLQRDGMPADLPRRLLSLVPHD